MPDAIPSANLRPLWLGFLFALAAGLCNLAFFVNPPAQRAIPWLSLVLALVALILLVQGARAVFARSISVARRVLGSAVLAISLLFVGINIFGFFHARNVPSALGAPQVGDKAPEFTLLDTGGQSVSMAQLFESAAGESQGTPPKALLLIFYRGYW